MGSTRAAVGLATILLGIAACGAGGRTSICEAYDSLRTAVGAMDAARGAATAGDGETLERRIDEVDRLVRAARGSLSGADPEASTASAARVMLEAANYLGYMTGQYRSTGSVDFSLTQFASRELSRAAAGAGGAPLNC